MLVYLAVALEAIIRPMTLFRTMAERHNTGETNYLIFVLLSIQTV